MRKYYLDNGRWPLIKSVVEEVQMKCFEGDKSEDAPFKELLKRWRPELVAYIAQTTIKAWENARQKPQHQEKFES